MTQKGVNIHANRRNKQHGNERNGENCDDANG